MNNVFILLGNILMYIMAIFSFGSAIYLINNILKSEELRDIRNLEQSLENNNYLTNNQFLRKKDFVYGYQNSYDSATLKKIEIENNYLPDNMMLFLQKEAKE